MRIKKGFELRDVCGEQVIVAHGVENIDFSKIISLNDTAAYLWNKVQNKDFTAQILANALLEEYDVAPAVALCDAEKILKLWFKIGLVE